MKIFLTGHTGFKGSWFVAYLTGLGHQVIGFSHEQHAHGIFRRAGLGSMMKAEFQDSILNKDGLRQALEESKPDVVFHFAAQALVSAGWANPAQTFETNVTGTLNVLLIAAKEMGLTTFVVTTDKVYSKSPDNQPLVESSPLGGLDPYSISKASADFLATSIGSSGIAAGKIVVLRAGNVIGGGDVSNNRLVKDILDAYRNGSTLEVRNPKHVRPWQHVLDCLHGYASALQSLDELKSGDALNVGPDPEQVRSVEDLVSKFVTKLPGGLSWVHTPNNQLGYEQDYLMLDSSKIRKISYWSPVLSFEQSLDFTIEWDRAKDKNKVTNEQVSRYLSMAETALGT